MTESPNCVYFKSKQNVVTELTNCVYFKSKQNVVTERTNCVYLKSKQDVVTVLFNLAKHDNEQLSSSTNVASRYK